MHSDKTKNRIYHCWANMKSRCLNSNNKWYEHYGKRGITICDEWMDFNSFYQWSINNGYSENLSIDRINNNKGYSPDNCRWATASQQSRNRRMLRKPKYDYYGVRLIHNGRYRADVTRNGKSYFVGYYSTSEEAATAREEFIRRNYLDPL